MAYLVAGIVALVVVLWIVLRRRPDPPPMGTSDRPDDGPDPAVVPLGGRYLDSGFPVSVDEPDGPVPGERELPDFQWPRILSVDLPPVPECGLTYPLIYTDVFQFLGDCSEVQGSLGWHQRTLLRRAREQAAVYCYRHRSPDCRGVNEVSHSFSHQCFQIDGETFVGVTITYFFECGEPAGEGEGTTPPAVTETPIPQGEPNCSSEYHFVAHSVSQILNDCDSPDRPAIERRKAAELLQAAKDHARRFCAGAREESCRIPVALGHDIGHHCFRSEPENAWFHTSTIIYFFACPPTA